MWSRSMHAGLVDPVARISKARHHLVDGAVEDAGVPRQSDGGSNDRRTPLMAGWVVCSSRGSASPPLRAVAT